MFSINTFSPRHILTWDWRTPTHTDPPNLSLFTVLRPDGKTYRLKPWCRPGSWSTPATLMGWTREQLPSLCFCGDDLHCRMWERALAVTAWAADKQRRQSHNRHRNLHSQCHGTLLAEEWGKGWSEHGGLLLPRYSVDIQTPPVNYCPFYPTWNFVEPLNKTLHLRNRPV